MLLIVAILVAFKLGTPILFKQNRPGLNEKIFKLYKFRTMTNEKDSYGKFLPDSERLTKFGKFLRSTSLDELPSLINVIKGEMSIVGPRPLLVKYLKLYNIDQKKRHLVRPGLTGLAQVKGRNLLNWEEKFRLDLEYVYTISFFRDLLIIFQTVFLVLKRTGISSNTSVTSEEFLIKNIEKDK